jgi:hypothetical protein
MWLTSRQSLTELLLKSGVKLKTNASIIALLFFAKIKYSTKKALKHFANKTSFLLNYSVVKKSIFLLIASKYI